MNLYYNYNFITPTKLFLTKVGLNHYTECQVFRNLGRKSSSYNDLSFKLAAVVPLRLLLKVKNENPKMFARLKFLIDTQTNSPSSFVQEDEFSSKRYNGKIFDIFGLFPANSITFKPVFKLAIVS